MKIRKGKVLLSLVMACFMCLSMFTSPMLVSKVKAIDKEAVVKSLIPKPLSYEVDEGSFTLHEDIKFVVKGDTSEDVAKIAQFGEVIAEQFRLSTGYDVPVVEDGEAQNNIVLTTLDGDEALGDEGYDLLVKETGVEIKAMAPAGIYNGLQTLRQLLPAEIEKPAVVNNVTWQIPCSTIHDKPEYAFRGMHLDVSRHFFGADEIKRQIDHASQYKINKLHLHLADDQGWRLEMKGEMYGESLDKLRTIGSISSTRWNGVINPGQYTQEEFKDMVRYAADRNVEIIPEFDMPSHSWAALVSLEFLNSTEDGKPHSGGYDNTKPYEGIDVGFCTFEVHNEKTYAFIDEVFRQVSEISPSKYIHIGGDEAHSTPNEDYVYFMNRVTEIAKKYGKTPIGWQKYDAGVEDTENTVTQFWSTGNAKYKAGIKYIASPADHAYVDMKYDGNCDLGLSWAGLNPVDKAYNWDPTNYGPKDQTLGVESCLWAETLLTPADIDYMAYPRLPGIAEIAWTPKADRSWNEYKTRIADHDDRLGNQGINYRRDEKIWEKEVEPLNAQWNLDEGEGTSIMDNTGTHPGTLKGGVRWVDGVYDKGLQFDGTGYVDLGIDDLQGDWTIGMWVNREENDKTNTVLISGSQGEIKLEQWKNTKKVGISEFGVDDYTFNYSTPADEWVHLSFVGDKSGTSLYVNGVYQDHVDATIKAPAKRLGACAKAGLADPGNMLGSLDDVKVFNRALNADEVADLMKEPDKGIVAEWDFNEGEGKTVTDKSGALHAEMQGNIEWVDGINGKALKFNGGYIDTGLADLKGDWSISLWMNKGNCTHTNTAVLGGSNIDLKAEQYKNTKHLGYSDYGKADVTLNYELQKDVWQHVVFVGSASGVKLYVDGVLTDSNETKLNGPMMRIGAATNKTLSSPGNYIGMLDEIKMYKRSLNGSEIEKLYNESTQLYSREELVAFIESLGMLEEKDYTEETWSVFSEALAAAVVTSQDPNADQKAIHDAYLALEKAYTALIEQLKDNELRIGSFNIAANRQPNIKAMNSLMAEKQITIAGIQEVDMFTSRNNFNMAQKFIDLGNFTDYSFQKAIDYGGGEYGVSILSYYPLTEKGGASLPSKAGIEGRAYTRSVFEKDGKKIAFYSTHLSYEDSTIRKAQIEKLLEALDADPCEYKVLTGDFNVNDSKDEFSPFLANYNIANGKDGKWFDTVKNDDPVHGGEDGLNYAIDNIITTKNIEVNSVDMEESGLSDHNLLYIDCELQEGDASLDMPKAILNSAILKAERIIADESFSKLASKVQTLIKTRLQEAKDVIAQDDASAEAIMTAWFHLADALHYVDFIADKAALKDLIDLYKDIDLDMYTDESADIFRTSYQHAEDVYKDENALQARIDEAYTALDNAVKSLVEKDTTDKTILQMMVDAISEKIADDSKYKKDSHWETFMQALQNAKDVLVDKEASQQDINDALNSLTTAYENIRLLPDESQLAQLQAFRVRLKQMNRSLYGDSQLAMIDQAYEDVQAMLNDFDSKRYASLEAMVNEVLMMKPEKGITATAPQDTTKKDAASIPETSDNTNMLGMLLLLAISGFSFHTVQRRRKS